MNELMDSYPQEYVCVKMYKGYEVVNKTYCYSKRSGRRRVYKNVNLQDKDVLPLSMERLVKWIKNTQ